MFDYVISQARKLVVNEPYRPKIFKTTNDVAVLSTDYDFDNGAASLYETNNLVAAGVDMKNIQFSSDVPLTSLNDVDKLVSNSLKSAKK